MSAIRYTARRRAIVIAEALENHRQSIGFISLKHRIPVRTVRRWLHQHAAELRALHPST